MNCRSWSFVDLHSGHRFVFLCLSWRVMTCVQGLTLNEPGSVPGLGPFRCTLEMGYLRKVHQASFISSIDLVLGFVAPGAAPKPTVPKVNLRLHTSSACPVKALMPGVSFSCSKVACIDINDKRHYVTTFATVSFRGTNPFATVKLRPTTTNDRSAPRILWPAAACPARTCNQQQFPVLKDKYSYVFCLSIL